VSVWECESECVRAQWPLFLGGGFACDPDSSFCSSTTNSRHLSECTSVAVEIPLLSLLSIRLSPGGALLPKRSSYAFGCGQVDHLVRRASTTSTLAALSSTALYTFSCYFQERSTPTTQAASERGEESDRKKTTIYHLVSCPRFSPQSKIQRAILIFFLGASASVVG
jgi:hypothetical protein